MWYGGLDFIDIQVSHPFLRNRVSVRVFPYYIIDPSFPVIF